VGGISTAGAKAVALRNGVSTGSGSDRVAGKPEINPVATAPGTDLNIETSAVPS
jgi:hypothetical protein